MVRDRADDVLGLFGLLELPRAEEVASKDHRVTRIAGELEATSESVGDRSLPCPSWAKEPENVRAGG